MTGITKVMLERRLQILGRYMYIVLHSNLDKIIQCANINNISLLLFIESTKSRRHPATMFQLYLQ